MMNPSLCGLLFSTPLTLCCSWHYVALDIMLLRRSDSSTLHDLTILSPSRWCTRARAVRRSGRTWCRMTTLLSGSSSTSDRRQITSWNRVCILGLSNIPNSVSYVYMNIQMCPGITIKPLEVVVNTQLTILSYQKTFPFAQFNLVGIKINSLYSRFCIISHIIDL